MYYYLYDTYVNDSKYEKVLDRIKTRLLDLDIQGKHERMSLLKNVESMIGDEVRHGAQTIIVIGNDKTFLKAVDTVARNNATIGIIPLGPGNQIAAALGIPDDERACDILAARKLTQFDLGQANSLYFFSRLTMTKNIDRLAISHQGYRVMPQHDCSEVSLYNFAIPETPAVDKQLGKIDPQDGMLDLVFRSQEKEKRGFSLFRRESPIVIDSIIQGKLFEVKSFEYLPLMLDGYKVMKTPVSVRLADKKLKVIVGKTKNEWTN
jgi:diacylglycerol kinase family enzyme